MTPHAEGTSAGSTALATLDMRAIQDSTPTSNTTPTTCLLLQKLPAELRNTIYELAFHDDQATDNEGYVNLITARVPSKNLLLTCRTIFYEARGLYTTAQLDFWTKTKFILDREKVPFKSKDIQRLPAADINRITSMKIHVPETTHVYSSTFDLIDPRIVWRETGKADNTVNICLSYRHPVKGVVWASLLSDWGLDELDELKQKIKAADPRLSLHEDIVLIAELGEEQSQVS